MLTAKQAKFVNEYLIDLNATQAAIRAGYSEKTAAEMGYENLNKPQIAEAIAKAQGKVAERAELSQDWVVSRLRAEAERMDEDATQGGRVRALELLGKHIGMFSDTVNVNTAVGITIVRRVITARAIGDGGLAPGSG
jgi:phage terminase small subunit